jgi:glutamate synthase (NADPH/NADH) small chain
VTQLEIQARPPEQRTAAMPWPTYPMIYRVSSAHEEAGERVYAVSTRSFRDDGSGRVAGLELCEVDAAMQPVAGSERVIPAQLVLLAMGFTGPERGPLLTDLGVGFDERGNVARGADWMSSVAGVFVCGDMGRGQSLIVWAIAEGRACAASVDRWLVGETSLPAPILPTDRALA